MQIESTDDACLVRRILGGDVPLFTVLVKRYEQAIHRMAANLLRRGDSVDDLAQEVFLAAYRNLHVFDPNRAAFATWLLTICKNKCLNTLRRDRPVRLEQIADPIAAHAPDRLAEAELLGRLDHALAKLPFEQRLAFVLAELMDMTCEQIGEIEQTPASTIRSRLTRARQALRDALKEFAGDTP